MKLYDTVCNLIVLNTYDCLFTLCFRCHCLLLHRKNSSDTLLLDLPLLLHWYEQRYCWVPLSSWGPISLLLISSVTWMNEVIFVKSSWSHSILWLLCCFEESCLGFNPGISSKCPISELLAEWVTIHLVRASADEVNAAIPVNLEAKSAIYCLLVCLIHCSFCEAFLCEFDGECSRN